MKKFIRALLVIIFIVVAAVLITGAIEPKDIIIQRSIVINMPTNAVFDQIKYFKNWPHWSPWYKLDTTAQITYMGADGQPGSSYHWMGNKNVGEGNMRDSALTDRQMYFQMQVIKPVAMQSDGFFDLKDSAGATVTTWSMHIHKTYPFNFAFAIINMNKFIGGDFENGLQNMKAYIEANAASTGNETVTETEFPAHIYQGIRKQLNIKDMQQFFSDSYAQLGKAAGNIINGAPAAIYYTWDFSHGMTDMAAAFPVSDTSKPVVGASCIYIPASKAYMLIHKGSYSGLLQAHDMLKRYVAGKGTKLNLAIEEYVVNPQQEKDSTKWVTNIYYLVQ